MQRVFLHASVYICLGMVIHAASSFDAFQDIVDIIDDHDHTYGLMEDIYLYVHGHSHDASSQDHSNVTLTQKPT